MKKVKLRHPFKLEEGISNHTITIGNKVFIASSLIDKSKDLIPFDLDLRGLDLSGDVWETCKSMYGFAKHVKACNDADLKYPVILNEDGFIFDGWHRVVKALLIGAETIKAVRFEEEPKPDYYKED